MSVDGDSTAMPPLYEPSLSPLEVTPPGDESPQLTRRKVVEALKVDLDHLREAHPEIHQSISNGIPLANDVTTPYGTLSRSQSRRGSYLFALGMTAGDDIAATFTEEPFRHNSPKYQCCFHQIHCKQGARYILIIGIIGIIVNILGLIFNHEITLGLLGFEAILLVLAVIAYLFLFLAMKKENEVFLIPIIIYFVLGILIFLAVIGFSIWGLINPQGAPADFVNENFLSRGNQTLLPDKGLTENQKDIEIVSVFGIVGALIGLLICLWFLFTIIKYYLYLRDMKRARHPQTIVYHGDMKNVKVTELTQ